MRILEISLLALALSACGPKNFVVMAKPVPSPAELQPMEAQARDAFVKTHAGFKVFSVSFDPPTFKDSEDKNIGAVYRNIEAWIGARNADGCAVFRGAFRATQAPDKTWTPLDWYADRDMQVVKCNSPWGEGPAPE